MILDLKNLSNNASVLPLHFLIKKKISHSFANIGRINKVMVARYTPYLLARYVIDQ